MEQPIEQPNAARPKSRTGMWIGVGCGVVALLAICCVLIVGITYFTGTLNPVLSMLGLAGKAQAAALAPVESPLFLSADLDLKQAVNAQKVWNIFQKSQQTQTGLNDLKQQFKTSTGCDFDADIASWWGPDMAVFFTDTSSLTSTSTGAFTTGRGEIPNMVVAIGARDQAKASAAIQKCSKEKPTSEETYKGVKISNFSSASAAVTRNYLLIATTPEAMHAALDASSGSSNLSQSAAFKNALAALPSDRVATMYLDMNSLMSAVYSQSSVGMLPQTSLDQLKAYQGMGASLSFTDNGLRVDTAIAMDSTKLSDCTKQLSQASSANQVLKAIPGNAYVSISSSNLKGIWDCTVSQMDATSKQQIQDSFDSLKKQMGIDVNADILSWMTGEFALAITPAQPLSQGMPGVGVVMLVQAQDQNLINSKMDKLSVLAPLSGGKLQDQTIKGNKMKVVTVGSGSSAISFGYGIVSNYFLLAGPMDALNSAIDGPKSALADDSTFKAVQAVLPARSNGYYYVNVTGLEKLYSGTLSSRDRTSYQQTVQPWLKPIKAIGLAGDSSKPNLTTATMFVYISDQ